MFRQGIEAKIEQAPNTDKFLKINKLVEAGGIEPPSERFQSKVSTCLVSVLNLTQASSQRQDSTRASPDCSHPTRPEHTRQTSPFK